jgi:chromosome segregation ATPase
MEIELNHLKKVHAGCSSKQNLVQQQLELQIKKMEEEVTYHKKNVEIEQFNKEQVENELEQVRHCPPRTRAGHRRLLTWCRQVKKQLQQVQKELKDTQLKLTRATHEIASLSRTGQAVRSAYRDRYPSERASERASADGAQATGELQELRELTVNLKTENADLAMRVEALTTENNTLNSEARFLIFQTTRTTNNQYNVVRDDNTSVREHAPLLQTHVDV